MGKRQLLVAILVAMGLVACGAKSSLTQKKDKENTQQKKIHADVIYGNDDRLDYYQITQPFIRDLADSTVALVEVRDLLADTGAKQRLRTNHFGSAYGLCTSEPYYSQHIGAFCSGFLVGPDLVATAGHCVQSQRDCQNTAFVFGFVATAPGSQVDLFEAEQVYTCAEIIKSEVAASGADYSLVRLDRRVAGRVPLEVRTQGELAVGDPIFVVGHPAGLPLKVAGGASVRTVASKFYVANLDTYGGNSGSAVFNARTGVVEGILVRGETDFVARNGCRISNQCADTSCRGEDVTKIKHISALLNVETPVATAYAVSLLSPLKIPDFPASGIEIEFDAKQSPNGRLVTLTVDIEHTWRGDLNLQLVSPDGTNTLLHQRSGGSTNDLRGTFGIDLVSVHSLSPLSMIKQPGKWILRVTDNAPRDVGQVRSAQLSFNPHSL